MVPIVSDTIGATHASSGTSRDKPAALAVVHDVCVVSFASLFDRRCRSLPWQVLCSNTSSGDLYEGTCRKPYSRTTRETFPRRNIEARPGESKENIVGKEGYLAYTYGA